ncbi:MAG: DUF4079 domain-containing protein [Aphanocapsa sp. GSE-SYN-MK-11-07L]|nr:DUF4079 domain-containing protein [Aphanocapsa sp. GSE-SYN-MK-11-07L]
MEIPAALKPILTFFHPVMMWILLGVSIYALYLGIQIRRTRKAEGDAKKALIQGKFNLKHHQIGSLLLALMVMGAIGGMGVTYLNNGKLFFGPHLLAGLGMTGMVALSAGLSPWMQKGQDWARYSHIGLNLGIVGLFGWQAVTGMQIVWRILNPS